MSTELERSNADRLAAISSAMLGLAHGISDSHPLGSPDKVIIELKVPDTCSSARSASAARWACWPTSRPAWGTIAYEMAMFANRATEVLTPGLIKKKLKNTVGS